MDKKKLILTSGVANTFEWYDYVLFAHLAPIIGKKFFPYAEQNEGILQVFLVFAVGYLMRPIGGIFFGIIGDKFGRKVSLSSAIICMTVPTAAIGFLPTYESWGAAATISMIIIRMLQGLSMGGALTGSVSFIIEHSKKEERGLFGSIPMSSICAGILLGSLMLFCIKTILSEEQFELWGWRVPFIIGIAIFFVGIYIKNHTSETPLFKEAKKHGEIVDSPFRLAFRDYWKDMLISILINMVGSVIFYLLAVYLVSYLKLTRGFLDSDVTCLINICYILMIFMTVFAGWISDKIGRKNIFIINIITIIIVTPFLLNIIESGDFMMVCFSMIILSIMAAFYIGPEPALQSEFYPTEIRNTALSISYNTATSLFGGTAPYVIGSLVQNTGTITTTSYYVIISGILSLTALYFYKDRSVDDKKI